MIGLVLVSHSAKLAEGLAELAAQMAPDVRILHAGGLADGTLGTDFDAVSAAVDRAESGDGVVLLYDLGSAKMTAELAIEMLGDPSRATVVDAPFVEGAVAAAVAAQGGGDLDAVSLAAVSAGALAADDAVDSGTGTEFVLTNKVGLHARPAALLARTVAELDAEVTVRFGDKQANAASVLALMGLGAQGGDTVSVTATGPDSAEAVRRVHDLVARGFDE
nr:dihydroxyacetone kinase phosphoryl donor subunit DhaM [Kibdelosporangium sp. MJ126-NF4]CEL21631.1 Phosphoenolpyruvate-dihydroxyacetone phosphotransferase, subunit DhaM; DHA-specific IIA component / DHA-specific phosphocarrier protein HPr [Kibdelosporangium sp. MJ126-NF4]CTQ92412.1 Phosphoenolpyruvate-dihydroxyacetone phosphotransferase (EC 2.7.1.121), subunit DhaM; DHA-specific IIA component / DHA-specific phosphocarrier protein HPr [Kibdelosporangium sp. MJ126-NF4]